MDYQRSDLRFTSHDAECAAWLYRPVGGGRGLRPAVVLGHGLGAVKEMGLDAYAARFASAGYVVLAFDYRYFGTSGGEPRQLLDFDKQQQDWAAAIACARELRGVDPDQVALFGSSFGGGHVIVAAARDKRVAAAISQCPFTNGIASAMTLGAAPLARLSALALRDAAAALTGRAPVMVPLAGPPGATALMNAADAEPGYYALLPKGFEHQREVAARIALHIPRLAPGRYAKQVQCPILFAVCDTDSVAPTGPTLRYAKQAPRGEVRRYPIGHFDIYLGDAFERTIVDQLDFLRRHVPV
jgi:dienelactone hydrolase